MDANILYSMYDFFLKMLKNLSPLDECYIDCFMNIITATDSNNFVTLKKQNKLNYSAWQISKIAKTISFIQTAQRTDLTPTYGTSSEAHN